MQAAQALGIAPDHLASDTRRHLIRGENRKNRCPAYADGCLSVGIYVPCTLEATPLLGGQRSPITSPSCHTNRDASIATRGGAPPRWEGTSTQHATWAWRINDRGISRCGGTYGTYIENCLIAEGFKMDPLLNGCPFCGAGPASQSHVLWLNYPGASCPLWTGMAHGLLFFTRLFSYFLCKVVTHFLWTRAIVWKDDPPTFGHLGTGRLSGGGG